MLKKIKNIIIKVDIFLFQKFGFDKKIYFLENMKEAKKIFKLLNFEENKNVVKFVGGCVRKAIKNQDIDDIDLATSLEPNEVKNKLNKQNIKVIDTGISHGTLTVILNKKKFEITTLRKDVQTDGRHANVQFTKNWDEDALRRDFTINAIYGDIDGNIFDPQNGIDDLKIGKIKFIGFTEDGIQEDYLRILRYIRFFTQYSKLEHEPKNIQSIKKNINGLNKVSNERIFDEVKKILSLKNIDSLFLNKESRDIITSIFPQFKFYERLKILSKLDLKTKSRNNYDYKMILALLIIDQTDNFEFFCYKYKISNKIKNKFQNIFKYYEDIKHKKFYLKKNIKKILYLTSKDSVKDLLLFAKCTSKAESITIIDELLKFIDVYKIPKFPVSGDFLKSHGYESGQEMGQKLKLIKEKWIENNFILDKDYLEKSLNKNKQN